MEFLNFWINMINRTKTKVLNYHLVIIVIGFILAYQGSLNILVSCFNSHELYWTINDSEAGKNGSTWKT